MTMRKIYVKETYYHKASEKTINGITNLELSQYGKSSYYYDFPEGTTIEDFRKHLEKDYGKATNTIVIKNDDGSCGLTGWDFEKIMKHDDSDKTYKQVVRVKLFEREPEVIEREFPLVINTESE